MHQSGTHESVELWNGTPTDGGGNAAGAAFSVKEH